MKKILAVIICLAAMLCSVAYAGAGEYLYIETEDGLYICGYTGNEAVLWLPAELDGKAVVGISKGAFSGNSVIAEVHIPDGYKVIGANAFDGCIGLKDVFIGSTLESIEERAFANCQSLISVAIATNDYSAHAKAFEDSNASSLGMLDRSMLWGECNGEIYDALYIAAVELMTRGEFEEARDIFLTLYGYELSADYYFYCSARLYESRGELDKALAIYALMPELNDCAVRLAYYKTSPEVESFFVGSNFADYYEMYFGEGGRFADEVDLSVPEVTEEVPVEAHEDDGVSEAIVEEPVQVEATVEPETEEEDVTIGGMLGGDTEPATTPEPEASTDNVLMGYHEYSGDMPYEYDDFSDTEGYYAMYYFFDELQPILDYVELFTAQGWIVYEDEADGWQNVYVASPDQSCYFYLSYSEAEGLLVLMYESGLDYGFDPAAGL